MLLFDHFRPPVEYDLPWDSLHSAWATYLATALNQVCAIGSPLPTMPLRLTGDLFVPVDFETTYLETCRQRRLIA